MTSKPPRRVVRTIDDPPPRRRCGYATSAPPPNVAARLSFDDNGTAVPYVAMRRVHAMRRACQRRRRAHRRYASLVHASARQREYVNVYRSSPDFPPPVAAASRHVDCTSGVEKATPTPAAMPQGRQPRCHEPDFRRRRCHAAAAAIFAFVFADFQRGLLIFDIF